MDDNELFSSSNSDNAEGIDLNSFSKKAEEEVIIEEKNKKRFTKEKTLKVILTVFLVCLITGSIVAGSFILYAFTMVDGTMDENLNDLSLNFTTTIYATDPETGAEVEYQRLHGEYNRIWVSFDRTAAESNDESYEGIPENLVNAFVAIEDKRVFSHKGVDWKRTVSAFANLFLHFYSSNQGGSTITQQLVKNLTGDASQKPSRKVREIMRARYLESHYSKDTIIECYLNTIAMGHGIYGVEVASNYYFGKSVNELSLTECASLAAITKSPTYYSPDDNPESNKARRETVLDEMYKQGLITEKEYLKALKEKFSVVATSDALKEAEINSYFSDALIDEVINDLAEKYNYDKTHAAKNFYSGGYKIYATINPKIQSYLDETFADTSNAIAGKDGTTMQGAMTVMDYNGNVLGMAGGIGKKTENRGFNRATDAVRQPGSTMKPIAAYAPSIENGNITYSTIVNDCATQYGTWTPVNWYNAYWGNITVQYALERSVNSIPVYLVNKLTPKVSYDFLTQKLGITTLTSEDINLSPLGMGGTNGGLTTMESAAAYAIFGNGGIYNKPMLYTKVTNQKGDVILSNESMSNMAISEDTATVMNHLLQGVVYGENGTGKGAAGFIPNMKIYAKTGTSNDANDLWFVGGSPYYVASCWCGFDTQQPIPSKYSGIAMKLWGSVMSKAHNGLEAKEFANSSYSVQRSYCADSGMLAKSGCPNKREGWYKKDTQPIYCEAHGGEPIVPQTEGETQ